jgi:N utilization substance protein A
LLIDPEERQALVLVAEDQLSLAIGKEGQNVRLAARLTGWKIDIKDIAKYREEAEAQSSAKEPEEIAEDKETSNLAGVTEAEQK